LEPPNGNELNRLLARCNAVGQEFGQPPLYDSPKPIDPDSSSPARKRRKLPNSHQPTRTREGIALPAVDEKFHVSIAWTLTRPDETTSKRMSEIAAVRFSEVKNLHIFVKEIKVKIGNIITSVELSEKALLEKGIF